tara:strand:+ start:431 stop:631 length:201 start_codon:yes stop_codon:yes gene_type:complete
MNFTTYILLGILFTFGVEYLANSDILKDKIKTEISFGFWERLLSILFWPLLFTIFMYNFFKSYLGL